MAKKYTEAEMQSNELKRIENEENRIENEAERIANEIQRMAKEEIRNEFYDGFNDRLNEVDSQLEHNASKVDAVKNELEVEKNRIDSLTKLQEGSTTGDAELIDARVGADGIIYSTLGDANRTQFKKINNKIIEPTNLLNEKKLIEGKYYLADGVNSKPTLASNSSFACILIEVEEKTTYTCSNYGFYFSFYDESLNYIGRTGSPNGTTESSTITTIANTKYIALNIRKRDLTNYMFVKGDTLPDSYVEFHYTQLKNSNYLDSDVFNNYKETVDNEFAHLKNEIYHVGEGFEYTSFTDCLKALKDNTNSKTIYVHGGVYDIFVEYGGTEFANTVTDTDWKKWCVFVPKNTHIIGIGKVVLNYLPSAEQTTLNCGRVIAPLNIIDSCTIENLEIHCSNGRYCIHDETGDTPGSTTKYKNVKCYRYSNSYGYTQAYGGGISYNSSVELDNCLFDSSYVSGNDLIPFSIHNGGGGTTEDKSSYININNCIFITSKKYGIRFGNCNYAQNDIRVNISNSYIGGENGLLITNEYNNDYLTNAFNVTILNCNAINEVVNATNNIYDVKKYNVIN